MIVNERSQDEMAEKEKKTEYERYLSLIQSFRDSRDLKGLERAADEINQKWDEFDGDNYFVLMLNICSQLCSYDFNEEGRELYMADKFAVLALEKSDKIPLEVEFEILSFLQPDYEDSPLGKVKASERDKQRANRVRLWLRAWQRLNNEIDPDFDFDDLPKVNIPPPNTSLRAGVAPEDIKDPILRAEYEAAIRENARKAEAYNRQYKLRQLEQTFAGEAEQYIIDIFSKPPFNLEELERLLNTYITDKDIKARILSAVEQSKLE